MLKLQTTAACLIIDFFHVNGLVIPGFVKGNSK